MPFFLYHPNNKIARKLVEANDGKDAFAYRARAEMEAIIRQHMQLAELEIDPRLYMHIGSLAGNVDKHVLLDADNPVHEQIRKVCDNQKAGAWSFVKLDNGPRMKCVIGYCNSDPSTPFLLTKAQMSQKGLIQTTHVPVA